MILLAFAEAPTVVLVPDGTIFIHIALILLMIWVLNRTFFNPINRVIEARDRHKGGRLGASAGILREASEKQAQYEAALLEARTKGYSIIEQERAEALRNKEEQVGAVREEIKQTLARENAELERQTAEVRAAIAQEAERMADRISANILKTA